MYEDIDYDAHHVGEFDLDGDIFSGELIFNRKKRWNCSSFDKRVDR